MAFIPPQTLKTAEQLGQLLVSARKAKSMSQATLAAHLNISQSRVSQLEQRADQLSVEQLMSWCAALGLDIAVGARGIGREPAPRTAW